VNRQMADVLARPNIDPLRLHAAVRSNLASALEFKPCRVGRHGEGPGAGPAGLGWPYPDAGYTAAVVGGSPQERLTSSASFSMPSRRGPIAVLMRYGALHHVNRERVANAAS